MAFCSGGFAKVKDFMHKVTDELTKVMTEITDVTGKIKAIEGESTVQAIVAALPIGSVIEGYLNQGMDLLVSSGNTALSLAEKIQAWLDGSTPDAKDAKLVKLAQVSTAIADNKQHPQSFYDTAVQVHIEGLK